jgi:vacuolar-type H+-ATPase subunit E/Vma4
MSLSSFLKEINWDKALDKLEEITEKTLEQVEQVLDQATQKIDEEASVNFSEDSQEKGLPE